MNKTQVETYILTVSSNDFNRLPVAQRREAAEAKYAVAVEMYSTTDLTMRCVAELCGVTPRGLSAHIGRNHRQLLCARYNLNGLDLSTFKVKPPKGQSLQTYIKYKDAVRACGDIAYLEYNVSQIAGMFGLSGPALASQLRVHYPDIIPERERLRRQSGLADNAHRGARQTSVRQYEAAAEMYRDTDLTLTEVAERCNVSKSGLDQYLRYYHKEIIDRKADRRSSAVKGRSERSGNGRAYGPSPETAERYAAALQLYQSSTESVATVARQAGVSPSGFRAYLKQTGVATASRRSLKAAGKYAAAIESLRSDPRPVSRVAADFGLNADVFRQYLKVNEISL